MRFREDEDQLMLRSTVRRFLAERFPVEVVRARASSEEGVDRKVWRDAADLGLLSLLGGGDRDAGAGTAVEAAIVAEEWGRGLQPGPFCDANVGALALARWGGGAHRELLEELTTGEVLMSWCGVAQSGWASSALFATSDGEGFVVDGEASFACHAADADHLLVSAPTEGGVAHLVVPVAAAGVEVRSVVGIDLTRRFSRVRFEATRVDAEARLDTGDDGGVEALEEMADLAALLTAADALGAARAMMEATVAYACDRVAFGRPIGSYQAIKHKCADMFVALEKSTVAIWFAALAQRDRMAERRTATSVAKSFACSAASAVLSEALQVHGGIGYTWEHDLHLYLRRTLADEAIYGDTRHHRARIAEEIC